MPREFKYTAIILKKQAYREADEIITFFSQEKGKVRALAKSVKSSKSKLQQKLQTLFLCQLSIADGKFPKIIGAETVKVYQHLREHLDAMKMAFYAVEVTLKITPDEQPNESLFNLLEDFFQFLDSNQDQRILNLGLLKFKMQILEVSGFGVPKSDTKLPHELISTNFSNLFSLDNNLKFDEAQVFLSEFIEQQLERKIQSERYLNSKNMV